MTYPQDRITVVLSRQPTLLPRADLKLRKVGGIWFLRAFRLRISFCVAGA